MHRPPTEMERLAERTLGTPRRWARWTRPFGEAEVWACDGEDGARYFLKGHRPGRAYRQERDAWRRWEGALPGWLPALLATDDGARLLLSRAAPGAPMDPSTASPDLNRRVFRDAGRLQALLDHTPRGDDDHVPLMEAMGRRRAAWCERAQGVVPHDTLRAIASRAGWDDRFRAMTRRPCHRDFTPQNWIVDDAAPGAGKCLTLIDLGHARDDLWLVDLVKLWATVWGTVDGARDAFFQGYGRPLSSPEEEALEALCLLHGLGTLTWATTHGDETSAAHGARILHVVLGGDFAPEGLPAP